MQTKTRSSVEADARGMMCGILYFKDSRGYWPTAPEFFQLSAYKLAGDRTAMMDFLLKQGWIDYEESESTSPSGRPRKTYFATERGRSVMMEPDPLPPLPHEGMWLLPSDPAEETIYGYHYTFFHKNGRWPNGVERARAFTGERARLISGPHRRAAYAALVDRGEMVKITLRNWKGDTSFYAIAELAPQFIGKHGYLYYAPALTS